jgi:hypothetical protein
MENIIPISRLYETISFMVIVLSVWDIIKLFISFSLGENTISEIIESIMAQGACEVAGAGHEKVMRALLWAGFMVVILIFSLVIFCSTIILA